MMPKASSRTTSGTLTRQSRSANSGEVAAIAALGTSGVGEEAERGDRGFDHALTEPFIEVDPRWRTIAIRTELELDRVARSTVIGPTQPGRPGQENEGHRATPGSTGGRHWIRPAFTD